MRDSLREEVAQPSAGVVLKAAPLSLVQKVELPIVEVPFSPFVKQVLAELSANLHGEVDGGDAVISGHRVLQRGKLLPKPKARMEAYRVSRNVFNIVASAFDAPLKVRDVREAEFVSVLLNTIQQFEQDSRVPTMVLGRGLSGLFAGELDPPPRGGESQ